MAVVTRGGNLPDTGVTKAQVYAMVDSATVTAIEKADVSATAGLAAAQLDLAGVTTNMTYGAGVHPKRSIILTAAGATVPATNGAEQAQSDDVTEGQPSFWTLNYDKTTDEHAYWTFVMPDSYDDDNITATVYWTCIDDTTASAQVQFELSFSQLTTSDSIIGAMGTATAIDDIIPASGFAAGDLVISSATAITGANFGDAGDLIICKLDRDIDGPAGTDVNADVKVLAVKLEWGKDQDTD